MILTVYSQILAVLKAVVHILSAAMIVWCFYRIANGQFTLL